MAAIRKRGPKQYQARIRLKGYPRFEKTFPTRSEAVLWAQETTDQLLRGRYRQADARASVTLFDALTRYATSVTPEKKGARQERGRIERWKRNPFSVRPLEDIRGTDLATYRDLRLAKGIAPNTIRIDLALISHLYEVARKDWGLDGLHNPAKDVRKPKLPRGRDRRLRDGEQERLLRYCQESNQAQLRAAIILATQTAMRRGELVSLRWEDIDLASRLALLKDTKNGDARWVPLSTAATAALQSLTPQPTGPVLPCHVDTLTWGFNKACRACGIEGLRFHDLRHEATSRLFERGFNIMEVSTITGHKSVQMLRRYTHLRAADLVDRLG